MKKFVQSANLICFANAWMLQKKNGLKTLGKRSQSFYYINYEFYIFYIFYIFLPDVLQNNFSVKLGKFSAKHSYRDFFCYVLDQKPASLLKTDLNLDVSEFPTTTP